MYSKIQTAVVYGMEAVPILVETDISPGMPCFELVGYVSAEVREARERVCAALKNCGFHIPTKRVTVNLSPAYLRKSGTLYDLPVAVGVLIAMGVLDETRFQDLILVGELGLGGNVRPVKGVLPIVYWAKKHGIKACIVPEENQREGALVEGISVYGISHLSQVQNLTSLKKKTENDDIFKYAGATRKQEIVDFSQIHGQRIAKRACEVAAAGKHHLLLVGPPGTGKTMLAQAMTGIMPDMEEEECLEVSNIYSVAGKLKEKGGLMKDRPFRAPHHTLTGAGLVGGGAVPKPGEVSFAHRGVLFLDELPEFRREVLETLREPLEEKKVHLTRLSGNFYFPADFQLVAAMNSCPCGYFPDFSRCTCTESQIRHYQGRLSGPFLDRIDMTVSVAAVDVMKLKGEAEESSVSIRSRVSQARERQIFRFRGEGISFNGQMNTRQTEKFCLLSEQVQKMLNEVCKRERLSTRSYYKLQKIARTIADLENRDLIGEEDLNEAFLYKDETYWRGDC